MSIIIIDCLFATSHLLKQIQYYEYWENNSLISIIYAISCSDIYCCLRMAQLQTFIY